MIQTQDNSQAVQVIGEAKDLINNLLILLSPKEKHIIENRYSLNTKSHATLESIGKEFGVTRERIRQIEKNALKKLARNVGNTRLNQLNALGNSIIQKYEGVIKEDRLFSEMLTLVSDPKTADVSAMRLSLELDASLERVPNTIHAHPYFKLKTIERNEITKLCEWAIRFLAQKQSVVMIDEVTEAAEKEMSRRMSKQAVHSILELDRRIKLVKKGVGLADWRDINPRTLRDKILYILNEAQKPLHYVEISNRIAELKFDTKPINVQAVHNELIRDQAFVLIGRGIYALRTWGYNDGTVSDVISSILTERGPLERDEIVKEVLRRRQVKKITIVLNLKNKPMFERVGRNVYGLKK